MHGKVFEIVRTEEILIKFAITQKIAKVKHLIHLLLYLKNVAFRPIY